MENVIVAPEVRDLGVFSHDVAQWFSQRIPGARDIEIANAAYPFGAGQSHETILFDASWTRDGERHQQGCVVRIKPRRDPVFPDDLFEEQYRVMQALHAEGRVPVARPMWFEASPDLFGSPFFVLEKVHGRVPVSIPPYAAHGWVAQATPAQRRRMWESGVRNLAEIQKTPLAAVDFLAGARGLRGLEQEWDKFERYIAWMNSRRRWDLLNEAARTLLGAWPKNRPEGVVWGDARLGNMMFDDDFKVVAVMDWEQPSLGGALHDLTWWLFHSKVMHGATETRPHLEGMGTREETIALWREVTGVSTDDIEWYEAFTDLKFAIMSLRHTERRGGQFLTEEQLRSRLARALSF